MKEKANGIKYFSGYYTEKRLKEINSRSYNIGYKLGLIFLYAFFIAVGASVLQFLIFIF